MAISALRASGPAIVLSLRNRFEMPRIHTWPIATQVIDVQAFRNRPNGKLIGRPVCEDSDAPAAVAIRPDTAKPDPASILTTRPIDTFPERGHGDSVHSSRFSMRSWGHVTRRLQVSHAKVREVMAFPLRTAPPRCESAVRPYRNRLD